MSVGCRWLLWLFGCKGQWRHCHTNDRWHPLSWGNQESEGVLDCFLIITNRCSVVRKSIQSIVYGKPEHVSVLPLLIYLGGWIIKGTTLPLATKDGTGSRVTTLQLCQVSSSVKLNRWLFLKVYFRLLFMSVYINDLFIKVLPCLLLLLNIEVTKLDYLFTLE